MSMGGPMEGSIWKAIVACLIPNVGRMVWVVSWSGIILSGKANWALTLYGAQLLLNWIWTPIYFGFHSPKWALVDIVLLSATVVACAVAFYKINRTAGLLMIPYLAWLGLATSLTVYIYQNN